MSAKLGTNEASKSPASWTFSVVLTGAPPPNAEPPRGCGGITGGNSSLRSTNTFEYALRSMNRTASSPTPGGVGSGRTIATESLAVMFIP